MNLEVSINKISEFDYTNLDIPFLFEDRFADRSFALVICNSFKFKIGWQSDIVEPEINIFNSSLFTIGIDLNFVIIESASGRILKKLSLNYYFIETRAFGGAILLITQLEIFRINISDLTIEESYYLPDFFESIELYETVFFVKCIGGEIVKLGTILK
ncbi:MAG: hypothetical protein NTW29_09065 [Bacteroidetes bacterium]|nr:hypothetical protein [Bacteroidota bacterium]